MDRILEKLKTHHDNYYINDIYRVVKRTNQNTEIKSKVSVNPHIKLLFYILISKSLVLINLFYRRKYRNDSIAAFSRVKRTELRLNRLSDEFNFISDNIKKFDFSIYRIGKRAERVIYILFRFDKDCFEAMRELNHIINSSSLIHFRKQILSEFADRIPHTEYYRKSIDMFLRDYPLKTVYTGQMYDRFALVESRITKSHSIKLICVPHGIETTETMPVGYVGDVFYATSYEMAERLNEIYNTNKYYYDENIVNSMFRVQKNIEKDHKKRNVVFFTQDLMVDETINVIKKISKYLNTKNEKLYIKVHPNENRKKYMGKHIAFIDDFSDAIINNVCISLISTSLLEAIYNDSISISIANLVCNDLKLEDTFYFLNDTRILKPLNDQELINIIEENYKI